MIISRWKTYIGFKNFEDLEGERKTFTGRMRTDGVDLEFMCERPKAKAVRDLTPASVAARMNLSNATVWRVDPGLTDIFVASDEYYQLAGFKKSIIKLE